MMGFLIPFVILFSKCLGQGSPSGSSSDTRVAILLDPKYVDDLEASNFNKSIVEYLGLTDTLQITNFSPGDFKDGGLLVDISIIFIPEMESTTEHNRPSFEDDMTADDKAAIIEFCAGGGVLAVLGSNRGGHSHDTKLINGLFDTTLEHATEGPDGTNYYDSFCWSNNVDRAERVDDGFFGGDDTADDGGAINDYPMWLNFTSAIYCLNSQSVLDSGGDILYQFNNETLGMYTSWVSRLEDGAVYHFAYDWYYKEKKYKPGSDLVYTVEGWESVLQLVIDTSTKVFTGMPSGIPTSMPTIPPSSLPTVAPNGVPTGRPSSFPTTSCPTMSPIAAPSSRPSSQPTSMPFSIPTSTPSAAPTPVPTKKPTSIPTGEPTALPTSIPSAEPTGEPTSLPTAEPVDDNDDPALSGAMVGGVITGGLLGLLLVCCLYRRNRQQSKENQKHMVEDVENAVDNDSDLVENPLHEVGPHDGGSGVKARVSYSMFGAHGQGQSSGTVRKKRDSEVALELTVNPLSVGGAGAGAFAAAGANKLVLGNNGLETLDEDEDEDEGEGVVQESLEKVNVQEDTSDTPPPPPPSPSPPKRWSLFQALSAPAAPPPPPPPPPPSASPPLSAEPSEAAPSPAPAKPKWTPPTVSEEDRKKIVTPFQAVERRRPTLYGPKFSGPDIIFKRKSAQPDARSRKASTNIVRSGEEEGQKEGFGEDDG